MPPIRTVFFDIGDTLVFDDPPLRSRFGTALLGAGISYSPRRLPNAFHVGEAHALTQYLRGLPWDDADVMRESAVRIVEALGLPPLAAGQWEALREEFGRVPFTRRVHPGAVPLLNDLRQRGFTVGAISDWDETLPELLADWGFAPMLDAVAVSSLVGATKPSAALFQEALRQAQADPETSLHVGDWAALDVAGACSVGMQALLFDHAGRSPHADCPRVQTFDALTAYLRALPSP